LFLTTTLHAGLPLPYTFPSCISPTSAAYLHCCSTHRKAPSPISTSYIPNLCSYLLHHAWPCPLHHLGMTFHLYHATSITVPGGHRAHARWTHPYLHPTYTNTCLPGLPPHHPFCPSAPSHSYVPAHALLHAGGVLALEDTETAHAVAAIPEVWRVRQVPHWLVWLRLHSGNPCMPRNVAASRNNAPLLPDLLPRLFAPTRHRAAAFSS